MDSDFQMSDATAASKDRNNPIFCAVSDAVNVGIFMTIWYNLWPFGIVCGHLLYFSQFGMFGPKKIWQPCNLSVSDLW
jgi:hypothetical protein